MNDNENREYGSNFVMYDPPSSPDTDTIQEEKSVTSFYENGSQRSTHVGGSYRDPRENYTGAPKFANGDHASWENGEVVTKKKKPKKPKTSKPVQFTRKSLALLIACFMLLSGICGFGGVLVGSTMAGNSASAPSSITTSSGSEGSSPTHTGYTLENATGSQLSVKEITAKCQPSVVEIKTESVASDSWMQQYVTQGAGSGVIISDDGYIMTNNHVIDGASNIMVTTIDNKEYEAKLIGTDSIGDVALIKIDAKGLTPATYGNSDQLEVGDLAVAIGNPLGELGGTVTAGIISAKDRELSIDGKTMHLLQTDSSINPGNSGGGLFNGEGQFIGLVVAKSSGSDVEGLGFAIPINTAADKAAQIKSNGYVRGQPWTGMAYGEGQESSQFDFFGMSGGGSTSVYIGEVITDTAKKAGFKAGDMVFAIDGKQITSVDELSSIVTSHKVGDKLTFTIVRDGMTQDLSIELQERTGN